MAQSASRSTSPRTATVATLSSQRAGRRGVAVGCFSASTAPFREDLSAIVNLSLEKLAQPPRQVVRRLLRARGLLHFRPSLRGPDLDPLHGARPGDFLDQPDVLAQAGR